MGNGEMGRWGEGGRGERRIILQVQWTRSTGGDTTCFNVRDLTSGFATTNGPKPTPRCLDSPQRSGEWKIRTRARPPLVPTPVAPCPHSPLPTPHSLILSLAEPPATAV
ncbi:hypothetical protein [Tolypothrix sp. VBCCA 56010]|uniref:hypothetical protein n=1 Tax=Tolypothrix sp. VBCCA 56010 TaxID=3137731 RepID=UPI003D7F0B47